MAGMVFYWNDDVQPLSPRDFQQSISKVKLLKLSVVCIRLKQDGRLCESKYAGIEHVICVSRP